MRIIQVSGGAVNSAEAKRFLYRIVIRKRWFLRVLGRKNKPYFPFGCKVLFQPVSPFAAVCGIKCFFLVYQSSAASFFHSDFSVHDMIISFFRFLFHCSDENSHRKMKKTAKIARPGMIIPVFCLWRISHSAVSSAPEGKTFPSPCALCKSP